MYIRVRTYINYYLIFLYRVCMYMHNMYIHIIVTFEVPCMYVCTDILYVHYLESINNYFSTMYVRTCVYIHKVIFLLPCTYVIFDNISLPWTYVHNIHYYFLYHVRTYTIMHIMYNICGLLIFLYRACTYVIWSLPTMCIRIIIIIIMST